jgi:hypothetical protein
MTGDVIGTIGRAGKAASGSLSQLHASIRFEVCCSLLTSKIFELH